VYDFFNEYGFYLLFFEKYRCTRAKKGDFVCSYLCKIENERMEKAMARENMKMEALSEQYLLRKNQIYLFGVIDTGMAARVIPQMHYIEQKMIEENLPEEDRVLTLLINSPGGSVSDGLAIYDTINMLECKVRTICVGLAASMGAFLLSSGTKGMRLALPNSEILIHQPLGGAQGQASDIIIAAKHIEHTRKTLNSILAMNTGRTVQQIAKDTDRDNTMTASEALKYGLIDHILVPQTIKAKECL
jgi:ATP-dependent Clp protease protease subunit